MNNNSHIESELKQFIATNLLFSDGDYPLSDDASFLAKGVVDSMGVMELVEHVSQKFGFEVPLEDITPKNFDSVTLLAGYVRRRSAEARANESGLSVGNDSAPANRKPA